MPLPYASTDDRLLWDIHLSGLCFPALTAADDAGLFERLATQPSSAAELAARTGLNERALRAILPVLTANGLLVQRLGRYHLTETARNYLLPSSAYYWGPVLALIRTMPMTHKEVMSLLRAPAMASHWESVDLNAPSSAWSMGMITPEVAAAIASYMNANSLTAAAVATQRVDLSWSTHLLDIGAGSGCFSIAFAQRNVQLKCTLMDLQGMCDIAMKSAREASLADRIDTAVVDMFRQEWPSNCDTHFFSNIFHDWDFAACKVLAGKSFKALTSGGRIVLHEMLFDDSRDGPATTAAFSLYMLLGTKGQQFSAAELVTLLQDAGFVRPTVTPCHGYYAAISAEKP
jgi:3-hydroxy-5-methyl-1-naphthoate 3-O-methyltransferase